MPRGKSTGTGSGKTEKSKQNNGTHLGFEDRLCLAADKLRGHLDAADYKHVVLDNPPFNMSDWGGERLREDVRWRFGAPPVGNANYAWRGDVGAAPRGRPPERAGTGACPYEYDDICHHNYGPAPDFRIRAALRDTLLPKLLSGELRVNDAEKFVEAAV